ncbi:MAG: hypothetical protein WCF69_07285 [Mycobacterium sp.]
MELLELSRHARNIGPIVVIGVGIAKADVEGAEGDHDVAAFVSELYPDGVYLSAPQGLDLATRVCTNHALGITRDQMIDGDEKMYSIDLSVDVVMGAEFHFCPAYDGVHDPVPYPVCWPKSSCWRSTAPAPARCWTRGGERSQCVAGLCGPPQRTATRGLSEGPECDRPQPEPMTGSRGPRAERRRWH